MHRRFLGPLVLTPAALAAGAGLAVWFWKRWGYPVRTHERDVQRAPDPPIPEPTGASSDREAQSVEEGTGPQFHRTYRVTIRNAGVAPEELIGHIQADIQTFVPNELARFEKVKGDASSFTVGDEFDIHITSPWDGPVRVIDQDASSFTFGTLEGHLEAGQIRFSAGPHDAFEGGLRFTIESWARSRDALVDLAYDDVGLAKAAQQAMWTFFCQQVVDASGGERVGEVEVSTERESESP
ncbi:MAG: hypothetical protein Rubg2KO_06950 [Rubricoccaceae bacterium]